MGNSCCGKNPCPTHPSQQIVKICMSEGCIEPLCKECVTIHRQLHKRSGYPPKIQEYDEIIEKIKENQRKTEKQKFTESKLKQILPRSNYIKELTREYFIERAINNKGNLGSKVKIQGVLTDLEICEEIKSKPYVKSQVKEFLKENLLTNKEVVGKDYQHLYE